MRTVINEASIVIQLLNGFNKTPILNADITCNGKHIPFIKKNSGHYIFINMHKANYIFKINAFGFEQKTLTVDLTDTSVNPLTHVISLNYTMSHPQISAMRKIVCTLKNKNKVLANTEVKLRLDTKVPQLRVIEPMTKGEKEVYLNSDFNTMFLFQSFSYEKKTNMDILFNSYDIEKKAYLNTTIFKSKVIEGGLLSPVWNLKTDENGILIIPIDNTFFQNDMLDFTAFIGKKSTNIVVEKPKDTLYIDINV